MLVYKAAKLRQAAQFLPRRDASLNDRSRIHSSVWSHSTCLSGSFPQTGEVLQRSKIAHCGALSAYRSSVAGQDEVLYGGQQVMLRSTLLYSHGSLSS